MQLPDDGRAFLTPQDLIELGYGSHSAVYRDVHAGIVPSIKVGKNRYIIPKDELIEVLESRRSAAPAAADGRAEAVM